HRKSWPIAELHPRIVVFRLFVPQFPELDVAGSTPVALSLRTLWERASRREFCERKRVRMRRPHPAVPAQSGRDPLPLPILLNPPPPPPLFSKRTNGSRVESCCHSYSVGSAICCAISLP